MSQILTLSDPEELEAAFARSHQRPLWIFKHSLICGISSHAWGEFREYVDARNGEEIDCAVIEIQNARPLSAAVAERTGIRHQSPQAILLSRGRPVWHASHSAITAESLARAAAHV